MSGYVSCQEKKQRKNSPCCSNVTMSGAKGPRLAVDVDLKDVVKRVCYEVGMHSERVTQRQKSREVGCRL